MDPLPDPTRLERYSDEQLYALARYLYALKPPKNPNNRNATSERGRRIFSRAGCDSCHTPPLYTSNKLTPVAGFTVPADHLRRYGIINRSVGTDLDRRFVLVVGADKKVESRTVTLGPLVDGLRVVRHRLLVVGEVRQVVERDGRADALLLHRSQRRAQRG
jgi:cytochrome c peroxidase